LKIAIVVAWGVLAGLALPRAAAAQPPQPPILLPPATTPACSDGIDNDGDAGKGGGGIDYPADYGCWGPEDDTETFPDDATTGPYSTGTTLRGQCAQLCTNGLVARSSSINTSAPGETHQCLDLTGNATITIDEDDTTIRCVRAIGGGVQVRVLVTGGASGVVIEDSEFGNGIGAGDPQNIDTIRIAGNASDVRIERVEIQDYGDGVKIDRASRITLRDNWIHAAGSGGNFRGSHADSIEMDGGAVGLLVEGSTHENLNSDTSMFMIDNWAGSSENITLRRNQLVGSDNWAGYTIYCNGSQSSAPMRSNVITANMVQPSKGWAADWDWLLADGVCASNVIVSGNRNRLTGALFSVYSTVFAGGATPQVAPNACNDGIDNDGDGRIDWGFDAWNDPGCSSGADTSE